MNTHHFLLNLLGAATLLLASPACNPDRTTEPESQLEPQPELPSQKPDFGPASPPAPPPLPERASCSGLTVSPGTYDWNITHAGRSRLYRVHVPTGYEPTRPTPAVLSFHGYGSNEQEQEILSRMSQVADAQGFIAVYPRGLNQPELTGTPDPRTEDTRGWNAGVCCGPSQVSRVDDVSFVDALLADLDTRVCLDTKRIYATGLSTGGFFSYRLACERSGQFAAIAPVSGMEGFAPCSPVRPVSVMHFHGTDDRLILYAGDNTISYKSPYPSATESVSRWAQRNVCTGSTDTTYAQGDSTCRTTTGCAQDTVVTLCTVQGGGHTWPGGLIPPEYGYTTPNLDATNEIWRFFSAHPRP
jgi:polyhydroxybutyrate depolymerase